MKIQRVKIATLALSACMALGVVCFAACGVNGKSAYEIWLEQGNTGTEQEFLNSLKGTNGVDGKDGKDGTNGTNGKDGVDGTNGKDGVDGTNGKDGVDGTNGKDGVDGTNGKDGATWHYGEGEPQESQGNEGDLYLDYTAWDVYAKKSTGWEKLGSMKGESEEPGSEVLVKDFKEITLGPSTSQSTDLDFNGVSEGLYYLIAETDSAAKANTLYFTDPVSHDGSGTKYAYDMYSPANDGEYRCAVYMRTGGTGSGLLNNKTGEDIKFKSVRLVKFDLEIQAGKEVVIPAFLNNSTSGKVKIPISKDLVGKTVKLTVWCKESVPGLGPDLMVAKNGTDAFFWNSPADQIEEGVWVKTYQLSDSEDSLMFTGYGGAEANLHLNIKIKFEIVEV